MQRSLCLNGSCLDNCWTKSDNKIGVAMNGVIYHERQVKEMCALHTLNNLFQEREAFNKYELDDICHSLSPNVWINPHKSLLGLGNYDVNVIMAALQRRGYEAIWFDKRKDPKCLNLANIFGFILNVPSDYKLGFVMLPLRRRHWVAIRDICGTYYNLDSKFQSPQLIGRMDDVVTYLSGQLQSKEKELFVVVPSDVERSQGWQLDDICSNHVTALDNPSPKDSHPAASVPGDECLVSGHSPRIDVFYLNTFYFSITYVVWHILFKFLLISPNLSLWHTSSSCPSLQTCPSGTPQVPVHLSKLVPLPHLKFLSISPNLSLCPHLHSLLL
uniref:Josephin-2 n=2 Tax=Timema TaxID=61471 RepID=A0A7R9K2D7_TIMGE|nr:unnamed protein product [Timema genevievae]